MRIELNESQLENSLGGVEIYIKGYKGNLQEHPEETAQIFIEKFDGKVQVHIWNGTQEPETFIFSKSVACAYPECKCPDCKEDIAPITEEGEGCHNCGHIFYLEQEEKE